MATFRPQLTVITLESRREYSNSYGKGSPYKTIPYPTYAALKKDLKKHLEANLEPQVSVSRSRRGEWGEWFENWELKDGKPVIVKKGWM